jgi:hypothetical protein
MSELLFQYFPVHPTTWVYLSSLLLIGLFFKFNRFWSVRNLDLVLLILLAPGLLLVHFGERIMADEALAAAVESGIDASVAGGEVPASMAIASTTTNVPRGAGDSAADDESNDVVRQESAAAAAEPPTAGSPAIGPGGTDPSSPADAPTPPAAQSVVMIGYIWLLAISGLFMVRMLLDPTMVRRPLLEPNLSTGGLAFIGCSLFVFLMANVVNSPCTSADLEGPRSAEQLLSRAVDKGETHLGLQGPGNALLHFIPSLVTNPMHWRTPPTTASAEQRYIRIAKTMAVLSNLAIVLGITLIGYRHFGSIKMGLGAASLYLMLPYNALMAGYVTHALPAALLVWAVLCYRRPLWAGMFIGMAIGVVYYPLFLLPLWISFYWQRGLMRFVVGVASMLLLSLGSLVFISADVADYWSKVRELFGIWLPTMQGLEGVWGLGWDPVYRYPVLAAFVTVSGALALWPAQKNLGTLLSCSAAIMLATQFWHGHGGGLYMAWFLPVTLLTIFRPNLEDRVALSVLGEGWFPRRKLRISSAAA